MTAGFSTQVHALLEGASLFARTGREIRAAVAGVDAVQAPGLLGPASVVAAYADFAASWHDVGSEVADVAQAVELNLQRTAAEYERADNDAADAFSTLLGASPAQP